MEKNDRPILWFLAVLVSVLSLMTAYAPRAAAQQPKVISNAFSNTPTRFDVSPPLGSLVLLHRETNSSSVRTLQEAQNPRQRTNKSFGKGCRAGPDRRASNGDPRPGIRGG
jgi:hypothetical protein